MTTMESTHSRVAITRRASASRWSWRSTGVQFWLFRSTSRLFFMRGPLVSEHPVLKCEMDSRLKGGAPSEKQTGIRTEVCITRVVAQASVTGINAPVADEDCGSPLGNG
jgi:hypothetical protein